MRTRPRQLVLSTTPRCPACGKPVFAFDLRRGDGFPQCERKRCRARFWIMALSPGAIAPQLEEVFDGVALHLMQSFGIPDAIAEPMFLHLPLWKAEYHDHRATSPLAMFRALRLVPHDS